MRVEDDLRELLSPCCRDVAQHCVSRGYWGACGIGVLFDQEDQGFVIST